MSEFQISERWLMDAGGWQAMKTARALWRAGAVVAAEFDGARLRGQVKEGSRTRAAGLLIKTATDVECLCSCADARRTGALCPHALAVGLAWIHSVEKTPPASHDRADTTRASSPAAIDPGGALSFQLPPNFSEGLRRGRLAMAVRVGEAPAESRAADEPFLRWLASQGMNRLPGHLSIDQRRTIDGLLTALAGHPRVSFGQECLRIVDVPARLPLSLHRTKQQIHCELTLAEEEGTLLLAPESGSLGWFFATPRRKLLPVRISPKFLPLIAARPGMAWQKPLVWLVENTEELEQFFDLQFTTGSPCHFRRLPGRPEFHLTLEGSLERLAGQIKCVYPHGPPPFPPTAEAPGKFAIQDPRDESLFYERNLAAEEQALARLRASGFAAATPRGELVLKGESKVLQFFATELPKLEREWQVAIGARFTSATREIERIVPRWRPMATGENWFSFDLDFQSERGTRLGYQEIRRLVEAGQGRRRLANGRIGVVSLDDIHDLEEALKDARPQQEHGHYRVPTAQVPYLAATLGAREPAHGESEISARIETRINALAQTLRPYQAEGIRWLGSLAGRGLGGILADEMGLGKTLQSLAVISALKSPGRHCPALVVCPKSLVGNWQSEATRFFPDLRTIALRSGDRPAIEAMTAADLVVTNFHLVTRDLEALRSVAWSCVCVDEASFIRNPDTQAARAVRQLNAGFRLALTGTPIENSLQDLWSIMEFAVPGYLGERRDFQDRYEAPAQIGSDGSTLRRLRRRMQPYWLRRLKQEVARDLPDKIVKVLPCELSDEQRALYSGLVRAGAEKVLAADSRRQSHQARMSILTTLLRLRQTCCDPRLLSPAERSEHGEVSGKVAALRELLDEIRDGGHCALIFSQFASMLRLLRETVTAAGLDYCHLDGSTADRDREVQSFCADPQKRIFLISLKAGGFGLNLTKADTVIHFDPWWNPAVEAQATDRAHRLGQARPVSVYKLIAAGTVEEKILRLQERKRGLVDAALDDTAPLMEGLTETDLRELVGYQHS